MIGFDDGSRQERTLDARTVSSINVNLTSEIDLTKAHKLPENAGIGFMGQRGLGLSTLLPNWQQRCLPLP